MTFSQRTTVGVAMALIVAVFACFSSLMLNRFRKGLVALQIQNHEKLSRVIAQSLDSYFRRVQFITEYAASDPAFSPNSTEAEDAIRYSRISRDEANLAIHTNGINKTLNRKNPTANPEKPEDDSVAIWQVFKGLPENDSNGRLLAGARRLIARQALRIHLDLHYVFEIDNTGDIVFLEPFETQKNIASFNYNFRDYLRAVMTTGGTALSEGYINQDKERTQIITVASPIRDQHGIAKLFAASISNATLRDHVFRPLREGMALQDETTVYLVDRHGHVVAASSESKGYQPVLSADTDEFDGGNIRNFGAFTKILWTDDEFEKGSDWERHTKSWDPDSLNSYYAEEYVNWNNTTVLGTFYPLSILTPSNNRWGILIETPIGAIHSGANQLKRILVGSSVLLLLTLLLLGWLLWGHGSQAEREISKRQKRLEQLSASVAHDIRSPLMTLQMLLPTMRLPEQLQNVFSAAITRLGDIANELSSDTLRRRVSFDVRQKNELTHRVTTELISSVIASLVTQKRLEYRNRIGVLIDFQMTSDVYGLFCRLERGHFERALSNIINNAAEAIEIRGKIQITLSGTDNSIDIAISDDGHGIPPNVMPKIFSRGASYGKPGGKGLGLYFARKTVNSLGGSISISSHPMEGTTVRLCLRPAPPPKWFCARIVLSHGLQVAIVDDDNSVHEVWNQRLATFTSFGLTTIHFTAPQQLLDYQATRIETETLYLIDHEFRGNAYNGLMLIETLDIASHSVLVTGHDENDAVRQEAAALGVRVLPKSMVAFVPIVRTDSFAASYAGES